MTGGSMMGVNFDKDVHTEHCCLDHGCKYGKSDTCSVCTGEKPQSYPCEYCTEDMADDKMAGEAIYRAMYEHQGGKWEANETKDVWTETGKRFRILMREIKWRS